MPPRRQLQHNRNQERDRSRSPIVEGDELVTALMTPRRPTRVVVDLREASPPQLREDSPPPRLESEADTAPVFVCSVTDIDGNERPLPSDVVLTIDPADPHRHRPRAAQHSAGKKRRQPSTVAMDRREGLLGPAEWRSSSPSDGDADPLTEARSESTAATVVAGGDSDDVAHLVHEAAGSDSASDAAAFNDRNDPDDELLVLQLRRRRGRPPAGSRSVSRQEYENDPTLAHPVPRATLESETVLRLKARLRLLGLGYQDHKVHLVERLLAHWNGRREGEVAGEQPHAPLHFGAEAGTALDDVEPDVPVELPPRPTFFFRAVRALTSLFESRDEETCDDASEPELELLPGDSDDDAEGAHSDDDEDDCNSDDDGANGRPPLL